MAYESKISNKRFGTTFAGRPQFDKNSPLGDIVDSIRQTTPQFQRLATKVKSDSEEAAAEKYQSLVNMGKNPDMIEAEIKAGQHPELNNMYSGAIINRQRGLFDGAKVIEGMTARLNEFDAETMDFVDWSKEFMPDLSSKGTHYNMGFSTIYQPFLSDQQIKVAETRNQNAVIRKQDNLMGVLKTADTVEEVFTLANSVREPVVSADGTVEMIYSNNEINDIIMKYIQSVGDNATTSKEVQFAINLLEHDRGKGVGGNPIGRLLDSGSDSVDNNATAALYSGLLRKKEALINDEFTKETRERSETRKSIEAEVRELEDNGELTDALKLKLINDYEATMPSMQEANNFRLLTEGGYAGSATSEATENFQFKVTMGDFASEEDMKSYGIDNNIDKATIMAMVSVQEGVDADRAKGTQPIFEVNYEYKHVYDNLSNVIDILDAGELGGGMLNDIEQKKLDDARNYFETQVRLQEAVWMNTGVTVTDEMRRRHAENIEKYLKERIKGTEVTTFKAEGGTNTKTAQMIDESEFTLPEILTQRDTILDSISVDNLANAGFVADISENGIAQNVEAMNNLLSESYISLDNQIGIEQFIQDIFNNLDATSANAFMNALGIPEIDKRGRFDAFINKLNEIANYKAPEIVEDNTISQENISNITLNNVEKFLPPKIDKNGDNSEFRDWLKINGQSWNSFVDSLPDKPKKPKFEGRKKDELGTTETVAEFQERQAQYTKDLKTFNSDIEEWEATYGRILKEHKKIKKFLPKEAN